MKKQMKKLALAKETVQNLNLQRVEGGAVGTWSEQMRICDSRWYCGVSQDTLC